MDPRRNNDEITDNFSDISLSKRESTAGIDKNNINHFVLRNNSLISYGEFKILSNFSNIKVFKEYIFIETMNIFYEFIVLTFLLTVY